MFTINNTRVFCEMDWYGTDCNTYCVPRDDKDGHWTCDASENAVSVKKCLQGWKGPNCTTGMMSE